MSYNQDRHIAQDATPAWEPSQADVHGSSADAGSLGAATGSTPTGSASSEADSHATAAATGPGSDAAAISFSISDVLLPHGDAAASGMGFSFAEAGNFSDAAMSEFMAVTHEAIGEIKQGLEDLLEAGSHDQNGHAVAQGLGHADATGGGAVTTADAHATAETNGSGAEAAAFSFSISGAETNGQDGLALATALGFAGAGDFSDAELAEFLKIAQHAVGEIAEALQHLLDSNDQHGHPGHAGGAHPGSAGGFGGFGGGAAAIPSGGGFGETHYDNGDYRAHDFGHLNHLLDADRSCWTFH